MNWSNLIRPDEETTTHPNKWISRRNNYFSQSGGEATKPNPTQNEPFLAQETLTGGDDTKQKTEIEATLNKQEDNRLKTTEKSKTTTSQNPEVEKTTKANPVQILLSGHSKEATNEDILQMFNQNEAPEIDRRGNYTILQFKEGIQSTKERGETGGTQIKTEMYHPLLDDLYNIPSPNKINKPNNTNTQTHLEEKETQPDKNHITQKDTEPTPFTLRPLPYPNPPLTTSPPNTHIH